MFGHDAITGSLEVGKATDLIVLDRDLLALAAQGKLADIGATRVLLTQFDGKVVHDILDTAHKD